MVVTNPVECIRPFLSSSHLFEKVDGLVVAILQVADQAQVQV